MHTNFYGVYLGYWYKMLICHTSGFWVLNVSGINKDLKCVVVSLSSSSLSSIVGRSMELPWEKKNYLYEALFDIVLMEREAAMRSVQRSHKLWHDLLLVFFDEGVPELSFLGLSFFRALKCQHVYVG